MSHVFPRHTRQLPPMAVSGEGCYLIDETGKRYLDASGGAAVSCSSVLGLLEAARPIRHHLYLVRNAGKPGLSASMLAVALSVARGKVESEGAPSFQKANDTSSAAPSSSGITEKPTVESSGRFMNAS